MHCHDLHTGIQPLSDRPATAPAGAAGRLSATDLSTLSGLLDDGLELAPDRVDAWLATLPPHQRHLVPALRRMLQAHACSALAGFMAACPTLDDAPPAGAVPAEGDMVGPYRLLRAIGSGGMGSVWLAQRPGDGAARPVAIKLLRPLAGADLVQRLHAERDITAMMRHPHVVHLLDWGTDSICGPYLALDHIDGQPLDAHCQLHRLNTTQRLRLFAKVAHAVAHAHGLGVVHRDLKPANVLVSSDGTPCVLDFGISTLVQGLPCGTATAESLARSMTPMYAAPEQLRCEPATLASDVYALGVMLLQLLTGQLPQRRSDPGTAAPPAGSSVARQPLAARQLRGRLDAILNKALAASPALRYASAHGLAVDIERCLAQCQCRIRLRRRSQAARAQLSAAQPRAANCVARDARNAMSTRCLRGRTRAEQPSRTGQRKRAFHHTMTLICHGTNSFWP